MQAPFSCTTTTLAGVHMVTVAGEVDGATACELAEAHTQFASASVRVDMSNVTFVDSSGLRALLAAHGYVARSGGRMIISGPLHPSFHRTLEISGLHRLLDIEDHPSSPSRAGDRSAALRARGRSA